MKKLKDLKLVSVYENELNKKEQATLKGCGCLWCSCGCKYYESQSGSNDSYYGGSSTFNNDSANDGGWF
ncbi:MAG: TIGR04149 family rSAM-modified RiPP [Parabacteroides sp.]|nr:TIGR04149 family rSAM-modified RiPP [Parabacteroides sp.]